MAEHEHSFDLPDHAEGPGYYREAYRCSCGVRLVVQESSVMWGRTAEGSTGAPLRQQIAEAIREVCGVRTWNVDEAADAVVALLNLTEEPTETLSIAPRPGMTRWVGPWRLPSTPPDTSGCS